MTIKKIIIWIKNKIQAFNESSLFSLIAKKNLELQKYGTFLKILDMPERQLV